MIETVLLWSLHVSAWAVMPLAPPEVEQGRTRLAVQIQPLPNLHQQVRAAASGDAPSLPIEAFTAAVEAARLIEPMTWGLIEGNLLGADNAAAMVKICERLPEQVSRGDREIELREAALNYARALELIEAEFRRDHWPQRRDELATALASLETTLLAGERQCIEHLMRCLAMDDPHIDIPVHLVTHAPAPGAITYRTRSGSACIVSITDLSPLLLAEIVLHEASHALDVATMRQPTALMQLRQSLQAAGVAPTDPSHRDIWHTIMFIQSAETIRRVVDPEHVDYGVAMGYYQRVAPLADLQRPIWRSYLDGQLTLDAAVQRVVQECIAAHASP